MPTLDNSLKSLFIDGKEVMIASLDGKVFYDNSYKLNLTASKPIIQAGETTVFTAGLTYRRAPVQGETVIFHSEDVLETTVVDTSGTYDFGDCFIVDLTTITHGNRLQIGSNQNRGPCIFLYNPSATSNNVQIFRNAPISYTCSRIMIKNSALYIESSNKWVEVGDVSDIDLTSWWVNSNSGTVGTYFYETGITDSNGECNVSYVGKGAGDLNIKCDCMNLIQTCSIRDAKYFDSQTVDKSRYTRTGGTGTLNYSSDGLKVTGTQNTLAIYTNTVLTLPSKYTAEITITVLSNTVGSTYCGGFGFDNCLIDVRTTGIDIGYFDTGSPLASISKTMRRGDVIKVEMDNGTMKVYLNNELKTTKTISSTGTFKYRTYNGRNLTTKDLTIL